MNSLRKTLQDYLALRRGLDYKLHDYGVVLRGFVDFLEQESASHVTIDLAVRWAQKSSDIQLNQAARRLTFVRGFARYLSAIDSRTEVPPVGLLPRQFQRLTPHIYSENEIHRLLEAARKLTSSVALRPWTYSTFLALLAVTGMRLGEAIRLHRGDVDTQHGILLIRQSKFGKDRFVPIHSSTVQALIRYANQRNEAFPHPTYPHFFLSDRGKPLLHRMVHSTFVKLSHHIGIRDPSTNRSPRLHDLRHYADYRTMPSWWGCPSDVFLLTRHSPEYVHKA